MVRGWKSNARWSFPRGKINLEESEVDCAIREVSEALHPFEPPSTRGDKSCGVCPGIKLMK